MPFFQNPFDREFRGSWVLGDRQYSPNFTIGPNINTPSLMIAWVGEPYDLSTNKNLTINYAIDSTLKQFQTMTIDVSGATASATLATEVASALNANAQFSGLYTASVRMLDNKLTNPAKNVNTVILQSKRPNLNIRSYISNTGAEQALHFNAKAPIAELPTYFERNVIGQDLTFPDSADMLILLDTGVTYDAALITAAGLDSGTVQSDWQLLKGSSGLFQFTKNTYDGSSRLSSSLVYPAGATVGYLAKLTQYQYSGASTDPSIVTEVPYTLTSGDLVTPP